MLQFSLRVSLKTRLDDAIFCWLSVIFLEFLPSTLMVFSFVLMIGRVRRHYGSERTLSKQLRYNHRCVSFKTYHGEKSAVIMMGIVIGVFVIMYENVFALYFSNTIRHYWNGIMQRCKIQNSCLGLKFGNQPPSLCFFQKRRRERV